MTYVLTSASVVQCAHGLVAQHPPSQVRVKVMGSPVHTTADIATVAGCPFTIPPTKPSPCVTVQWAVGATRVRTMGVSVLLQTSVGLCKSPEQAPQGPPVTQAVQMRVKGM